MPILTRSKSTRSRFGGRDAVVDSSASLHVTENAQAYIESTTEFQFELRGQDRHELPERPRTSGGSNKSTSRLPKRANTVRRESRDDLYFNPLTAHGKDGPTLFTFPLPASHSLPKSATSKVEAPPTPKVELLPALESPISIKTTSLVPNNISVAEIGMALGSPEHPPENWQQAQKAFEMAPASRNVDENLGGAAGPKQKGRWKLFGGMFRPKKEKTPASFYSLDSSSAHSQATSADPRSPERSVESRDRSRSLSKKPDMKRSHTAPINSPLFVQTPNSIHVRTPGPVGVEVLRSYPKVSPEGPKLDVDIPSVHLDRYSVMFGSLLQKPPTTNSALLQRRQATLDRLKTVEEALATKEAEIEARTKAMSKRRATSPQQYNHGRNTPSFSLFPSSPSRQRDSSPSRERLHRSNTSPAALSPRRPSFAPSLDDDHHAKLISNENATQPKSTHHRKRSTSNPNLKQPTQRPSRSSSSSPHARQPTRTWSPEESQLLSPSSEESEIDAPSKESLSKEDSRNPPLSAPVVLKSSLKKTQENEPVPRITAPQGNYKKAPSSLSGSTTSEASTSGSSSQSNISFSSVRDFGQAHKMANQVQSSKLAKPTTTKLVISGHEMAQDKDARKSSPTVTPTTKTSVKSLSGPSPAVSAFNTTSPRPILKSPVQGLHGLAPAPRSRPPLTKNNSTTSVTSSSSARSHHQKSLNTPRPSIQTSSSTSDLPIGTAISSVPTPPIGTAISSTTRPTRETAQPLQINTQQATSPTQSRKDSASSIESPLLGIPLAEDLPIRVSSADDALLAEQKRREKAAGVSIARQISVSRQQRQLLVPIRTGSRQARSPREKKITGEDVVGKKGSPLEKVAAEGARNNNVEVVRVGGENTRVSVKEGGKPATPTLVLVPGVEEMWGNGKASVPNSRTENIHRERSVQGKVEGGEPQTMKRSPVLERGAKWEADGGKLLSLPGQGERRTEMGIGHARRRSSKADIIEVGQ